MSFSFSPMLVTDLDWVRADLGDTDQATAILSDEQINAVLAAELGREDGSRQTATWRLAAQAQAVIAREPVKLDAAGESHDYSQRLTTLAPLASAWRALEAARQAEGEAAAAARRQPTVSVPAEASW